MSSFSKDSTGLEVAQAYAAEIKGKTGKLAAIYTSACGRLKTNTDRDAVLVLLTGPSEGTIGAQTVLDLATGAPKEIILAGRALPKIQPVIDQVQSSAPSVTVTFVQLDLADLASVRKAAEQIKEKTNKLDVLINNAGGQQKSPVPVLPRGPEHQLADWLTIRFQLWPSKITQSPKMASRCNLRRTTLDPFCSPISFFQRSLPQMAELSM